MRPSRSFIIRPNILGNQWYNPPNSPNNAALAITKWKCATTKNVSCRYVSTAGEPKKIPVRPPVMNSETNPIANSIAEVNWMRARHKVATQLKVFTAEGIAIASVVTMKAEPTSGFMPLTNMWCPHTRKLRNAIAHKDTTIAPYPKMGLRPCTARISETMPIGGRMGSEERRVGEEGRSRGSPYH